MDDEHSAHNEQVNIAQQSDKDAVLEVIPSTSAANHVRSFIIIYHYKKCGCGYVGTWCTWCIWCVRVMNLPTLQFIVPGSPWARRNTR